MMKIFILFLEESKKISGGGFVIQDLEDIGLFVRESAVKEIETAVQAKLNK